VFVYKAVEKYMKNKCHCGTAFVLRMDNNKEEFSIGLA